MILHILDGSPAGTTVFSDVPIELGHSPVTTAYFQNQIVKVSQDGAARLAILDEAYAPHVAPLYRKIVVQPADFVPASQELGDRLYQIMRGDQRIAAGDLVTCVFTADGYDGSLLALLKLDPTHAIVHRSRQDAQGRWIVTLEAIADALPTVGERLQKAAFAWHRPDAEPEDTGWELLVLDRQVGEPGKRPAADFFLRRFLGAKWKLTPQSQTNRAFGAVAGVAARLYRSDDPARWTEAADIFHHLDAALRSQRIDLDTFVQDMDVQEDTRRAIREELDQVLVQRELEVHRATADKLICKVRFRGEDDLVLTASADVYERLVKEATIQDGDHWLYRITIETRRWQRLKPRGR
jgi:hypothetical protein